MSLHWGSTLEKTIFFFYLLLLPNACDNMRGRLVAPRFIPLTNVFACQLLVFVLAAIPCDVVSDELFDCPIRKSLLENYAATLAIYIYGIALQLSFFKYTETSAQA